MNIEDIYVVDFTEAEKKEAREWAEFLRTKNKGMKTVRVSPDQDVTGYLGHTAIERVFDDFGIPYLSTKKQRFTHGDAYDIEVKGCFVDSKSHKLAFNDKYFFNEKLFVFGNDLKNETHYTFTRILPDFSKGYVYGIISVVDYYSKRQTATLPVNDYRKNPVSHTYILSKDTTPIVKWALGVQ